MGLFNTPLHVACALPERLRIKTGYACAGFNFISQKILCDKTSRAGF
jgi:hypothetical protein